mmetsp:Transcript_15954/g.20249  ORF Transcript_15954/g.20249 Transcript_15954/m.20249 type:complete len:172 (-) Transcript_15954:90-605(-)
MINKLTTNLNELNTTLINSTMFASIKTFTFLAVAFMVTVTAQGNLSPSEIAEIFKAYDTDVDDEPDCQPQYIDDVICPKEGDIPCSTIPKLENYCAELLGKDIADQMKGVEKERGMNAMEGCMKYVGYHVVDKDHLACCISETCEDWLEDQFSDLDGYYDDDDYYGDGEEF